MPTHQPPSQLVIKHEAGARWHPLWTLIPLVLAGSVFAGLLITDEATFEDIQVSLIGISALSIGGLLATSLFAMARRWWDVRRIRAVYADVWAVWPQYRSDDQWRQFADKQHQEELEHLSFNIIGLSIVMIVLVIISVVLLLNDVGVEVLFGMVGFALVVIAVITGQWLMEKREISGRYKRRITSPPPQVVISQRGCYHEDEGYYTLNGLRQVEWKAATKSRRARLHFVVYQYRAGFVNEIFTEDGDTDYLDSFTVDVPRDCEDEAQRLKLRFEIEVLNK